MFESLLGIQISPLDAKRQRMAITPLYFILEQGKQKRRVACRAFFGLAVAKLKVIEYPREFQAVYIFDYELPHARGVMLLLFAIIIKM